jgi:hypothetical protein
MSVSPLAVSPFGASVSSLVAGVRTQVAARWHPRWPWLVALGLALAGPALWALSPLLDGPWAPIADAAAAPMSWRDYLGRLIGAAAIGAVVTAVHRHVRSERTSTGAMDQAQVLLCLAGALMMMLIGGSLAHAFGVAGAASVVRFRTPIEDPRDITVLFLVMGLGMAVGVGAYPLAALGALCLCALLPPLARLDEPPVRTAVLHVSGHGAHPPTAHTERVLAAHGSTGELRELVHGPEAAAACYVVRLGRTAALDAISRDLLAGDAAVRQVAWAPPKRNTA